MNDPEVTRYTQAGFFPNSNEAMIHYIRSVDRPRHLFLAIVRREDHRHIGNIKLGPIDWIHRYGDVGIVIGDKACWGKGYGSEAIRLIVEHAFKRLNLHKVTAGSATANIASIKAFERCGFVLEGVRRKHLFIDGKYEDVNIMGIINSE